MVFVPMRSCIVEAAGAHSAKKLAQSTFWGRGLRNTNMGMRYLMVRVCLDVISFRGHDCFVKASRQATPCTLCDTFWNVFVWQMLKIIERMISGGDMRLTCNYQVQVCSGLVLCFARG